MTRLGFTHFYNHTINNYYSTNFYKHQESGSAANKNYSFRSIFKLHVKKFNFNRFVVYKNISQIKPLIILVVLRRSV